MKIPLTRGLIARVDRVDYKLLSSLSWCDSNGYAFNVKLGYMHRFLMSPASGEYVDHINGDKLDNRRDNLRLCSPAQNSWNSKLQKRNTSGYKGVYYEASRRLWRAMIMKNGRHRYLGRFKTSEEASRAYQQASLELHGEFGRVR